MNQKTKRLRKNKKALEVSVNFLVVVIFGIITLSMGIIFLSKLMNEVKPLVYDLSEIEKNELNRRLSSGERTAIVFNKKPIYRNQADGFALGILNVDALKPNFKVSAKVVTGVDEKNAQITCEPSPPPNPCTPNGDFTISILNDGKYTIKNNEDQKIKILVKTPEDAQKGTYVMNVYVCSGDSTPSTCDASSLPSLLYGLQKAYIVVG